MTTEHRQVTITTNEDEEITCDEGIADIILLLNNQGFYTNNSCQEGVTGDCWISFDDVGIAGQFIFEAHKSDGDFQEWLESRHWRYVWRFDCVPLIENGVPVVENGQEVMEETDDLLEHIMLYIPQKEMTYFRQTLFKLFDTPKLSLVTE